MANINFPSTISQPTDGSFSHTAAGITWSWDGTTWKCQGINLAYTLPTASATVKGGIKVGNNLSINSSTGVLSATSSVGNLNDLGDVSTVGASSGEILKYNGSSWAPAADDTGVQSAAPEIEWTLTANGSSDYIFAGDGFPSPANDPTLYLVRGQTYKFANNTGGHPFRVQSTVAQAGGGTAYNDGVTNQDAAGGSTLTFLVPMDAPDTLYYQCTAHPAMTGTINVLSSGGGAASGLEARTTGQATTAILPNEGNADLTITAAKTYALHAIQTSHAAWVTLYTDTTSRTNDAARNETTDPLPGAGVIAEVITSDGSKQRITPGTIGYNDDGTPSTNAYIKVVNKSGSTANITVTLHYVKLEV